MSKTRQTKLNRRALLLGSGRVAALGAGAAALTTAALATVARQMAMGTAALSESAAGKVYLPLLAAPNPLALLTLAAGITMQMQPVAAGEFVMGSNSKETTRPQHRVSLGDYWISRTPVTVAQYAAFVRATGYEADGRALRVGKEQHAVNYVSWDDAQAFCRWASEVTGQGVRLPSEAEWEKAARGTDGRSYPWGEAAPDSSRANCNRNVGDTTPVGQYSPQGDSPYGCVDMAGQVWEWTNSLSRGYPYDGGDGRESVSVRGDRMVRGGSWLTYGEFMTCAVRYSSPPTTRADDQGFRFVVTATAGASPTATTPPVVVATATPTATATPAPANTGSITLAAGVTMQFVRVPAGEFVMGSDKAKDPLAYTDELPQHRVTLAEYWIGKTEVTVAQFAAFVRATGYAGAPDAVRSGKDNHPVTYVSWDDAQAFCRWASGVVGQTMRLPSEAEWEKAARGPSNGSGADRIYPWGGAAPDSSRLNYNNNVGDTTAVGQYSPLGDSPYGCVDMAGNVWEWVNSLYRPYPYNATDGRENTSDRGTRVLRGGSFLYDADFVRCAYRRYNNPVNHSHLVGFRGSFARLPSL